jgi:hypothetical protein
MIDCQGGHAAQHDDSGRRAVEALQKRNRFVVLQIPYLLVYHRKSNQKGGPRASPTLHLACPAGRYVTGRKEYDTTHRSVSGEWRWASGAALLELLSSCHISLSSAWVRDHDGCGEIGCLFSPSFDVLESRTVPPRGRTIPAFFSLDSKIEHHPPPVLSLCTYIHQQTRVHRDDDTWPKGGCGRGRRSGNK